VCDLLDIYAECGSFIKDVQEVIFNKMSTHMMYSLWLLVKCRQGWKCIETLLTTATGKGGGARCCYVCWGVDCMCSHHYQPLLDKGMQVHKQIRQRGIGTISPNATRWGRSSIVGMLNACASVTLLVKGQVY
jgi:hypothetical protein